MSVNQVTLVGQLGKDPEIKVFESGVKLASISLATTDKGYTKKDGTKVEDRTEWHNIIAWAHTASFIEMCAQKGDKAFIQGRLTTESWEDQNGVKRYATKIVCEHYEPMSLRENREPAKGYEQSPLENATPPLDVSDAPPETREDGLPF